MDATFFSSIKKYKKSNAISFESVPLDIKIDVFSVKKEHTFSGFPHILIQFISMPTLQDDAFFDLRQVKSKPHEISKFLPQASGS